MCLSNSLMCGRLPSNQGGSFRMVGHAFWVDECPCNLHEVDGRHFANLHQCIHHGVFRWHLDLQPKLGTTPPPYSTGTSIPATTQVVCQYGEMHFWHEPCSISSVHHWWEGCACWPSQDTSHSRLANPNHSDKALQLSGPCQFLPQVCVGVLSYHLAFKSSHQGKRKKKSSLIRNPIESACWVEAAPLLCTSAHITRPATTIWDWDRCLRLYYWCSSYSIGASSGLL